MEETTRVTGNPVRMAIAEAGEKPPYKEWRTPTFFFAYDWETRAKRVWVISYGKGGEADSGYPPEGTVYGPNEHLYRIQCNLPPPVAANGEGGPTMIDIPSTFTREELETLPTVEPDKVIDYMAQRLFCSLDGAVPRGTFQETGRDPTGRPYSGLGAQRTANGFTFQCYGGRGKFRVTIEEVE
jgi:hypothetical protein